MGGGDLVHGKESLGPNVHKRNRVEVVLCGVHGHGSLWAVN